MREDIFIENKQGEKLAGWMGYKEEGKLPAVILFHGLGVTKEEKGMFNDIVASLIDEGYITFRFDFSGCGGSEGNLSEMTPTKRIDEVKTIVEFVTNHERVIKNKIGIISMSFGTFSLIGANPKVKCIVLLSGPKNPSMSIANLYEKRGILDKEGISDYKGKKLGPLFWKCLEKYDVLEMIKKVKLPVLVLQGDNDQIGITEKEAKEIYEVANKPKEIHIIKGANHGFEGEKPRKEMINYVKDWFKRHLQ